MSDVFVIITGTQTPRLLAQKGRRGICETGSCARVLTYTSPATIAQGAFMSSLSQNNEGFMDLMAFFLSLFIDVSCG